MKNSSPSATILFSEYEDAIVDTDTLSDSKIAPILFGLFGEVGSLMSVSKKRIREKKAFKNYLRDVEEELGDILWYVAALCRRIDVSLSDIVSEALNNGNFTINLAANGSKTGPISRVVSVTNLKRINPVLLHLGEKSANLLSVKKKKPAKIRQALVEFIGVYIETVQISTIPFANIVKRNIDKTRGRFIKPSRKKLHKFDHKFPKRERIPRKFKIKIKEPKRGECYLRWRGVVIGNALSDNIRNPDKYRFHDVFHLSYAAVLHWSPTFRALIKHKRKSNKKFDETEDSGRPRLIEEGLSAYIFSHAKDLKFFKGHKRLSFGLLKDIQNFVRGYEVEKCPLYLWEDAILQGYKVFRKVRKNKGGIVIGDRKKRRLIYKPLK